MAEIKRCPFHNQVEAKEQDVQKEEIKEKPAGKCPFHKPAETQIENKYEFRDNNEIKSHFRDAYNQVARNADIVGNQKYAAVLMNKLGYTQEELDVIGEDVCLMQGTGNPHRLARIQAGETVLDLGSGLGVDAFLAASRVGSSGKVIGLDLSEKEVNAARERATRKGITNVEFRVGDIENIPLPDNSVDVVISNGGFCLVPDKPRSFREIYRVLKPGGRMSICCTTQKKELPSDVKWPICMQVFMRFDKIEEILTSAGLEDIFVDATNSRMDIWDSVKVESEKTEEESEENVCPHLRNKKKQEKEENTNKITVHRGDPAFDHLKNFDMNELCARVTVFARKSRYAATEVSPFGFLKSSNKKESPTNYLQSISLVAFGVLLGYSFMRFGSHN